MFHKWKQKPVVWDWNDEILCWDDAGRSENLKSTWRKYGGKIRQGLEIFEHKHSKVQGESGVPVMEMDERRR